MIEFEKLSKTTVQSTVLTHHRLKYLGEMAQSTEDHISRLGMALSLAKGEIESSFSPSPLSGESVYSDELAEKQLRGQTLFKDDLPLWMALMLRSQTPENYTEWRSLFVAHWERGVQLLMEKAMKESDWLKVVNSCLNN